MTTSASAARQDISVDVAIIGAGPAGLTAGYLLTKAGKTVAIIEKDATYVGGISRTVEHDGYRFDIGGHRFFSKSAAVVDLWNEILPDDFIQRPRMSRIYYEGKFYSYGAGIAAHWLLSSRAVFVGNVAPGGLARTRQKALFVASAMVGLALTIAIVWIGTASGSDPRMAKLAAIVVSFAATWLLRARIVFR